MTQAGASCGTILLVLSPAGTAPELVLERSTKVDNDKLDVYRIRLDKGAETFGYAYECEYEYEGDK